jgi:hypothetical protein
MGTRADFYVGRDPKTMEWLGSIAFDGSPDGWPKNVSRAKTEEAYRRAVARVLSSPECDHATVPGQGWPWPWEDSRTTDYAYAFESGKVWGSCYGSPWFDLAKPEPEHEDEEWGQKIMFPDMTARQKVTWGRRSGVLLMSFAKGDD